MNTHKAMEYAAQLGREAIARRDSGIYAVFDAAYADYKKEPEMNAKPCPFCGGTDVSVIEGSTFRWRKVRCNDCDAECGEVRMQTSGPRTLNDREEQAHFDAFKEWNTRYEEEMK